MELAVRLDRNTDNAARVDVQYAAANQVLVDNGIEVRVIDDVVDVAVDVVVHPARRDEEKMPVVRTRLGGFSFRHALQTLPATTGRNHEEAGLLRLRQRGRLALQQLPAAVALHRARPDERHGVHDLFLLHSGQYSQE